MYAKVKGVFCHTSWEPFTDIYITGIPQCGNYKSPHSFSMHIHVKLNDQSYSKKTEEGFRPYSWFFFVLFCGFFLVWWDFWRGGESESKDGCILICSIFI